MGSDPPSEIDIKIHPRRGDNNNNNNPNSIHPENPNPNPEVVFQPNQNSNHQPFKSWFSWLIPLFFFTNIIVFGVTMYVNNCPANSIHCIADFLGRFAFQPMKENPLLGPSSSTLDRMGAQQFKKVVHDHQGWRLVTSMWLHAGVFHLLANMLSLLFIGIRLEQEFGFVRIGLVYLISGLGGNILSALFIHDSISVGASGALFGLLGAMLSELLTNWTIYANKLAALLTLLFVIAINLAVGILPHVDNFAHIGGFISGFLLGFVFLLRPQFGYVSQRTLPNNGYLTSPKSKHKTYQYILLVTAAILLIVGFTVGLVMLFRGVNGNDHCSWCHYLSCIPTSSRSCKSGTQQTYCLSSQSSTELILTCEHHGRNQTYPYGNATDSQIRALCLEQCS